MRSLTLAIVLLATVGSGDAFAVDSAKKARFERLKAKVVAKMKAHPARSAAHWADSLGSAEPVIAPAPPEVLEYVLMDNRINGFRQTPVQSKDRDFIALLDKCWKALPESIRAAAGPRLAGLFVVEDLGSSGYAEAILDADGNTVGAWVVFDAKLLDNGQDNWTAWKESTPFKPGPFTLEAHLHEEASSKDEIALQYILLHELGHVIGEAVGAHPQWLIGGGLGKWTLTDYPFLTTTWDQASDGSMSSKWAKSRPTRLRYYAPTAQRASNAKLLDTYQWLSTTGYPTAYASVSVWDDFADSFANYVHVVLLKRPFRIEVLKDGKTVWVYGHCWDEPRCAAKKAFLAERFGP